MKKSISIFCILLGITFFTQNLGAADCQSNGQAYWCMSWEFDAIREDAHNNCCAGSTVVTFDVCLLKTVFIQVNEDGPYSSCATE